MNNLFTTKQGNFDKLILKLIVHLRHYVWANDNI